MKGGGKWGLGTPCPPPLLRLNMTSITKLLLLFDLFIYVPSAIFQLNRDGSSLVEPVLS